MSSTLTARISPVEREALILLAKRRGLNLSELVREILRREIEERPLGLKAGHLKGRLRIAGRAAADPWRRGIRERNRRR
jgi:hypothetical protein